MYVYLLVLLFGGGLWPPLCASFLEFFFLLPPAPARRHLSFPPSSLYRAFLTFFKNLHTSCHLYAPTSYNYSLPPLPPSRPLSHFLTPVPPLFSIASFTNEKAASSPPPPFIIIPPLPPPPAPAPPAPPPPPPAPPIKLNALLPPPCPPCPPSLPPSLPPPGTTAEGMMVRGCKAGIMPCPILPRSGRREGGREGGKEEGA